jgi:hypothetical protein
MISETESCEVQAVTELAAKPTTVSTSAKNKIQLLTKYISSEIKI